MATIQDLINDPLIAKPNPIQMGFRPLPTDTIAQLAARAPATPMTPQFVQAAADRNAQNNAMQSAWNSGKSGVDSIANVIDTSLNPVSAPLAATPRSVAPPVNVTNPGTRTATQGAPAPGSQGSIEQLGGQAGVAPAPSVASVTNPVQVAQNALSSTLAPTVNRSSDLTMRGNAGIAALANSPTAQGQFNALQAARGNGISAATGPNGQLSLSNDPSAPTTPQSFTQGFDLASQNAKQMASQDAWNDHVAKGQIADLVKQLGDAPVGSSRAAALTGQIAQLSGVQNATTDATSKATLQTAQGNLANAQAQGEVQKINLSAASQKQLTGLQQQFIGETDPNKAQALQEKILTLMGKDPKENAFQIVTQDELNDPSQPLLGSHKVAAIVNSKTGLAQSIDDALKNGLGAKPPGGSVPLPNHVAALKANPKLADQFDATYGKGAAKKVLGG